MTPKAVAPSLNGTRSVERQGIAASAKVTWSPIKITPPAAGDAAPNARLVERLETALARPIVWLHGPPGAGKTTLVARYLADKGVDPIWYRLDDDDADPASLFFYIGLAATRATSEAAPWLPVVRPEYLRAAESFSRRFFRALFSRPDRSVLVFDDYHELDAASAVHGCLAEGLSEVPPNVRVFVISRSPPPKEFARLRMNGAIDVILPNLLRLTSEEAGALAHKRALRVAPTLIERLVSRTDGWTAGLILMMEAAHSGETDFGTIVQPVPELLFDYFAGEVFQRMDVRSQYILMALSVVPSMSASAAAVIVEDEAAVALLEDLARRNYFTVRDDEAETNYRFHPLFRDFLTTQACRTFDDAKRVRLRLRAAEALEQSGQIEAAIPLYEDAEAWDDLSRIVRIWASTLVEKGRHSTLRGWLDRLPRDKVDDDGWLSYWFATAQSVISPARSRPVFRHALTQFEATKDAAGQLLAWAGLASSVTEDPSSNQADLDGDIALLRGLMQTVPSFPSPVVEFRVSLSMYLALARRSPDRVELALWRDRALASAATIGRPGLMILIRNYIAINAIVDGDFATAREQFESIPPAEALDEEPLLQAVAYLTQGLGQLYGQIPGRCGDNAERALAASRESGIYLWTHVQAAFDAVAENDLARSRKWLRRMAQLTGKVAVYHSAHYQMISCSVALLGGDVDGAIRSGRLAVDMTIADGWFLYEAMTRIMLAQALDSAGELDAADAELDAADAASERIAGLSIRISTIFLRADFLLQRGHDAEGLPALEAAMEWGERTLSRRTGLQPPRNSRLCARALIEGIRPDYARLLIRASSLQAPDRWIEQWPWPLKIMTFGEFRIFKDGKPLAVSRKAPRRLFALLKAIIAFGGTNVPETKLIDAIWPDEEGDAGHRAFDVAIHRLRKLIGDGPFVGLKDGRVSLDPSRCWLDLWAFEAGLAQQRVGATDFPALALYKGPFLADDEAPWIVPRRTQLAARFAQAREHHTRIS